MGGYVSSGVARDRAGLMADLNIIQGDVETVYQRLIPPSTKEVKAAAGGTPADGKTVDPQRELRRLEDAHTARLLELSSARRTLRTYRRGAWSLMAAILVALGLAGGGVLTSIASSVMEVDATAAVVALMLTGFPLLAVSSVGMYFWQHSHRIQVKRIERGYGTVSYEGVDYLDPKLNVELAQAEYSKALARLTEYKGTKSDRPVR